MTVRTSTLAGTHIPELRGVISGDAVSTVGQTGGIITSLNHIISKAASDPKLNPYETFPIGNNKFFLKHAFLLLDGNNGVLQAHTGFFSTVKPGMGQSVLNLNIATSAFYRPILVSDYLKQVQKSDIRHCDQQGRRGIRVYIDYLRGDIPQTSCYPTVLPVNRDNARVRTIFAIGQRTVENQRFVKDKKGIHLTEYLLSGKFLLETIQKLQLTLIAYPGRLQILHRNLSTINLGSAAHPEWYCLEHLNIWPFQP